MRSIVDQNIATQSVTACNSTMFYCLVQQSWSKVVMISLCLYKPLKNVKLKCLNEMIPYLPRKCDHLSVPVQPTLQ